MNVRRKFEPSTRTSIDAAKRLRYAKNREKRASPCMYPMEYRWMRVPTPVTNNVIVDDSGSTRKRKSTRNVPAWIHVNPCETLDRVSGLSERRAKNATTEATNDNPIIAVPIQPALG